ncbi:Membrane protein YdfJ [Durusdinium trenchii]|uniref:Membrane protein YdfJ n=1 Tax=Durusdinium trenchii TaxID=1381693 RepID=A0ABP0K522_9DINO
MDALGKFCDHLIRRHRIVLVAWALLAAICAPFALRLVDHCKFTFEPVKGTQTYEAQAVFMREFPENVNQDVELILISCESCSQIAREHFAARAVQQLRSLCSSLDTRHPDTLHNWTDHLQFLSSAPARLGVPSPFLSASNRTMLFQLSWTVGPKQHEVIGMLSEVRQKVHDLQNEAPSGFSIRLAGQLALFTDTLTSTRQDIEKKDIVVMPFALLVLASRVGSLRLMLIPICCLICSLSSALGLFLPFAVYVVDISPLAPSTMVFLGIALAIDYSLFMLTRYMEEAESGASTELALKSTMRQSGHVVMISASVLIICYVGVLFYPSGGIATIGLGASLTVFLCALSNLTLTPALTTALPSLFGAENLRLRASRRSQSSCGRRCNCRGSGKCWPRVAKVVTKQPGVYLIPIVCLAFLLPACAVLLHYHESFANTLTFPGKSDTSLAYHQLISEFPAGKLSPQYVIIPASGNETVRSDEYFNFSCHIANSLLQELSGDPFYLKASDFLSPALLPSSAGGSGATVQCLNWRSNVTDALHPFGPLTAERLLELPGDIGETYREQWQKLVSSRTGEHSSILMLTVPFDPFSDTLWPFVLAARHALEGATADLDRDDASSSSVLLFGTLTVVFDIVQVTYRRLPYIVCGTVLCVFSLIAYAFRAALAPVKMLITVVVPLAAVFGVAVWVYQFGAFNWLPGGPGNNPFTSPPGGGFYWAAPVFTCTIIIGLALDYDVFLFARVVELRKKGYSNPAAVRGGLTLTGPTITAAGLIMAIAFGGLLLSDVPSNNQIGFVMAFGVLMDTFVIRTCLVPSVLTLAASLNYWPQQMPEPGPLEVEMLQHSEPLEPALH